MRLSSARLPANSGDDRIFTTSNGVVVLDGATAYRPHRIAAADYAETLGRAVADILDDTTPIADILRIALQRTITNLGLEPYSQSAPSSTVAVARAHATGLVDVLVLGDSTAAIGYVSGDEEILCDNRLQQMHLPAATEYRARLRQGHGYDQAHREILATLQETQRSWRNQAGGYWIASADPEAAYHAVMASRPADQIQWLILATDGTTDTVEALNIGWHDIAECDDTELHALLTQCQQWEEVSDPNGTLLPRPKRHDDKTVAVIKFD